MDKEKEILDSFRVEEAYNWRNDIMEITRRIVYETDEARLNNIAEHFEVDLSEIREFLESKQKRMGKPITNGDRIRTMTDEEIAELIFDGCDGRKCVVPLSEESIRMQCVRCWAEWLKQETQ